jgi:hypothetical protein|tara:strand:+ start:4990 stop:5379 length:390 start_codon:yes stop_codon:yes gene_type:complete
MKNQLFRTYPDLKFTESLLKLFGIKDINDNHSFTRDNLQDLKTVEKVNEIIDELNKYYLPCKSKKYLSNLNEKKTVTILRQFLKTHNYTLISKEKYVKGEKRLFYQVIPQQIDMLTKDRELEKVILSFD